MSPTVQPDYLLTKLSGKHEMQETLVQFLGQEDLLEEE